MWSQAELAEVEKLFGKESLPYKMAAEGDTRLVELLNDWHRQACRLIFYRREIGVTGIGHVTGLGRALDELASHEDEINHLLHVLSESQQYRLHVQNEHDYAMSREVGDYGV